MKILYLTNPNAENLNELPDFMKAYGDEVTIYTQKIDFEYIQSIKADFVVSDRYEFIIKKNIIDQFNNKIINLHPSILPWNKGYHSNFWSIYDNTPKGVSIHVIDEGIDTGHIVAQEEVDYYEDDTLRTTYKKLRATMVKLFFSKWEIIKKEKIDLKRQDIENESHHFKKEFDQIFYKLPNGWDTKIIEIIKLKNEKNL
jgi:methionyl-tRNA formyltransferase